MGLRSLVIGFLSMGLLSSCGNSTKNESESSLLVGKLLSGNEWAGIDTSKVFLALDKWFSRKNSSVNFFNCVRSKGIDHYIATYNANLPGGQDTDYHLENANRASFSLSAYYAWNNASGLDDDDIDVFLDRISGFDIKYVFIDIETYAGQNREDLIFNLYDRVCFQAGYRCGVYTNHGGMAKAQIPYPTKIPLSSLPLWYADGSEILNPNRQFSRPFFGWRESMGRQAFINDSLCGHTVDVSVMDRRLL